MCTTSWRTINVRDIKRAKSNAEHNLCLGMVNVKPNFPNLREATFDLHETK